MEFKKGDLFIYLGGRNDDNSPHAIFTKFNVYQVMRIDDKDDAFLADNEVLAGDCERGCRIDGGDLRIKKFLPATNLHRILYT